MDPRPTRYGTHWHLPARKPTIVRALQLLELRSKPRNRQQLEQRMQGWRHGTEGPWGAACGNTDEWIAVQRARDAYMWLAAQLEHATNARGGGVMAGSCSAATAPSPTRKGRPLTEPTPLHLRDNPGAGRPTGSRPRRPQPPMDNPTTAMEAGRCFAHRTRLLPRLATAPQGAA